MDGPAPDPPGAAAEPRPLDVALKGLCPRCGQPTLFAGWLKFARTCRACGLDFAAFNLGDGPAAFLTLIWGTLVVGLAVWLQVAMSPPWWVHVLVWVPVATLGVIASLRIAKAALVALEYRNHAAEARRG